MVVSPEWSLCVLCTGNERDFAGEVGNVAIRIVAGFGEQKAHVVEMMVTVGGEKHWYESL